MNDVKLTGRLVRDPELKHTPNGVPVATFSLAVDRNSWRSISGRDSA